MRERQKGIFDHDQHKSKHARFKDPLAELNQIIDWQIFLPILNRGFGSETKGPSGRKPYDRLLMFKILVLQAQYNIGDDQTEYLIHDRESFRKFLGLDLGENIPDAKTIWAFRDNLAKQGLVKKLFAKFGEQLQERGYQAEKGQILDASIIPVPKQRNSREENQQIKSGEIPETWQNEPNKLAQKDVDARWTKKNEVNHFGYKNHIEVDVKHKLVREYEVTDAALHDSQVCNQILDPTNSSAEVYADSAYRSVAQEAELREKGYRSKIHQKGKRNKPLTEFQQTVNQKRAKVRARIEHVFGYQTNSMGGKLMRCIGIVRATAQIGLRNLVYNLNRLVFLVKQANVSRA
jgi:transposase, IS5 family